MAHKTLVGGTAYEVSGGRTLVGGTGYEIAKGRTLVGGTGYDIPFAKPHTVKLTGPWSTLASTKCYVMIDGVKHNTAKELLVEEGTSIVVYCGATARNSYGKIRVTTGANGVDGGTEEIITVANVDYPSIAEYDYTDLFDADTEIYITLGGSTSRVITINSNDTKNEVPGN